MFSNSGMTEAMVIERQRELRQAADRRRLARLVRRGRQAHPAGHRRERAEH